MSTTSSTTTRGASSRSRKASSSATPANATEAEAAPSGATTGSAMAEAGAPPAEQSATATPALRKKELIDRVVQTSGMKRRAVKPVVEATLAVMGQALTGGESLNLQPLGRVVVNRRKELANGEVLITRIRRTAPAEKADDGADTAEATAASASAG